MISAKQLRAMARGRPKASNVNSVMVALEQYGPRLGLDRPHRLAHYLAQLLHESASFKYDEELWGPTPAQKRYEGRKNLGNVRKGDGSRYRGRGPIQITGRANYRAFTKWAKSIDPSAPDFEAEPEKVNTDPWEGLGPLWYWSVGNPTGKSLNRYADQNNIEMVTRRINGGLNGFSDRLEYYGRAALVLLGYGTSTAEIKRFQHDYRAIGGADGIIGQNTRMALHQALKGENPYREVETVEKKVTVDKPTMPDEVEREVEREEKRKWWQWLFALPASGVAALADNPWLIVTLLGVVAVVAIVALVGGRKLVRRVRVIAAEVRGDAITDEAGNTGWGVR